MIYVLYTIFFASCLLLIAAVLLQPGKTDAGALFTSNVSSAAFGPRGTASVLSKLTIVAAVVFMLSALLISMPALSGNISVLNSTDAPAEESVIEPQTEPANTNIAVDNSNSALIETPATNAFEQSAANSASNTSTAPASNSNVPANR